MISTLGAGSGLDLQNLVSQLVAAEGQPTTARLGRRETEYQANLSGLGQLSSALSQFRGAVAGLKDAASFNKRSITLAKQDFFTVSAASTAALGNYEVEVTRLARSHKLTSAGYANEQAAVGTGTLTISAGASALQVTIDGTNNSLAGLRDAINQAAAGNGVSATIINADNGAGGTASKLLLTSLETGAANQISVVVNDSDGVSTDPSGLSAFAYQAIGTQNLSVAQTAVDAQILIDGQTITRASNSIGDAINGITLNLSKAEPGTKVTLGVTLDQAGVTKLVTDFAAAYNSLNKTTRGLSSFDQQGGTAGLLLGDATLRGVERRLRGLVFGDQGASPTLPNLSAMGLAANADGSLAVDQAKLGAALEQNFDALAKFFSGADGLAGKLVALADDYVGGAGAIAGRTASIETSLHRIEDQRGQLNVRLDNLEKRLRAEFSALDRLVASLKTTGDYLAQQLASLPGFSSNQP